MLPVRKNATFVIETVNEYFEMNMKAIVCSSLLFLLAVPGLCQISGSWKGKLEIAPQKSLNLVLHFNNEQSDTTVVTLDSPDQGARGISCEVKHVSSDSVSISIPTLYMAYTGRVVEGKLVGTFVQGAFRKSLTFEPGEVVQNRPQTPQPPFPYSTEELRIENTAGKSVLAGTLTLPETYDENTPLVVMLTGSGLQNRDEELFGHRPFAVIADYLARRGIASMRYDDRGFAGSTGDVTAATISDFTSDALAVVKYLQQQRQFANVGLLGHSEGGLVAFRLASDADNGLKFVVGIGAPAVRGDSILVWQSRFELLRNGLFGDVASDYCTALARMYDIINTDGVEAARNYVDNDLTTLDGDPVRLQLKGNLGQILKMMSPYLLEFISLSPAQYISQTSIPSLVVYGGKDMQVPPVMNEPAVRAANPNVEVRTYPHLNHLMQHAQTGATDEYGKIEETVSPEVLEEISNFVWRQFE